MKICLPKLWPFNPSPSHDNYLTMCMNLIFNYIIPLIPKSVTLDAKNPVRDCVLCYIFGGIFTQQVNLIPLRAKRVDKFIEIRREKISPTRTLGTLGCPSLCNSVASLRLKSHFCQEMITLTRTICSGYEICHTNFIYFLLTIFIHL